MTKDTYFMVVNRHCLSGVSLVATVTIGNLTPPATQLYDIASGETLFGTPGQGSGNVDFSICLPPGGGRLFKLIPAVAGSPFSQMTAFNGGARMVRGNDGTIHMAYTSILGDSHCVYYTR